MKRHTYKNGRMVVNTGHKTFDRQADLVLSGNVCSTVQLSSHIRAETETECNGHTFAPGALRDFDLKSFDYSALPKNIREAVCHWSQIQAVILYQFHHWRGRRDRVIHGYVITDASTHRRLAYFVTGPTYKSHQVIDWCLPFITNP